MTQRSPGLVLVLTIVTFGIYAIVWCVSTKKEMVAKGAEIPTAWLLIVPFANIWWEWKYSQGVEHVTKGSQSPMSAPIAFLMIMALGAIGMAIIQSTYNKLEPPQQV